MIGSGRRGCRAKPPRRARRPAARAGPPAPPGTTAGPAGSATAVRWLIQGAWGTPWHAGTGPGAMHRWTTVALPPQRLGRVGEREPSVPLRALREALGLPDPCHPVRPPRCARPRPRAQAVQRGGPGEGTRVLGACRQDAHGRVIRRPARLPGRLACHTSRRVPPPLPGPPPAGCRRLGRASAHHVMPEGAEAALFARRWGRRLLPPRARAWPRGRPGWDGSARRGP